MFPQKPKVFCEDSIYISATVAKKFLYFSIFHGVDTSANEERLGKKLTRWITSRKYVSIQILVRRRNETILHRRLNK